MDPRRRRPCRDHPLLVWQFVPESKVSKRSVAIVGFRNQTGDKAFDYLQEAIPNLLITSLEQSGHFRVTSWQRLKDILRQSGRDETAAFDEDAGFEVCRKEGIEALVTGSYIKAGETFATDVKVLDAATKQLLKSASSRGQGASSILVTQIDELSRSISRGIGLPALKIEKPQPKIADLTTASLEAYNYFLRGQDELDRFLFSDARRSLEKAIALDPTFAMAHFSLAGAANEMADYKARDEAMEKAKKYSEKATEKERLYIEVPYAAWIERDSDKQGRLLRELTEKYPQEKYAHLSRGSFNERRGNIPEGIEEYEKALALDPDFGLAMNAIAYAHAKLREFDKALQYLERYAAMNPGDPNPLDSIAETYLRMGKLDEAVAKYKEVITARPDFYLSCASLAYAHALREDYPEANRWLEELVARAPSPTAKTQARALKAFFGYLQGRWDDSLAAYLSMKQEAEQSGTPPTVSMINWITGFIYADRGDYDLARMAFRDFVAAALELNPPNQAFITAARSFTSGWVDLKQGRLEDARAGLREARDQLPGIVNQTNRERATFLNDLLGAEIAAAGNSPDEAVAQAGKVKLSDLVDLRIQSVINYNLPLLKDVLARAYWKKGDLDRAVAEYRKLLTIDSSNQVRYLIHPLYHYRLGRILEEKGDKAGAAVEYRKFLEYWKDADASHPELTDARKRLR